MKTDFSNQEFVNLCNETMLFFRALLDDNKEKLDRCKYEMCKILNMNDQEFSNLMNNVADRLIVLERSNSPKIEKLENISISENKLIALIIQLANLISAFVYKKELKESFDSFLDFLANDLNFSHSCYMEILKSLKNNAMDMAAN